MSRPDAIVIGAGFAGLSAAVRLAQRGARVLVIEERRRLGGRATAHVDPGTGERVDNGQHALFGCYHETFAFLETIGARDRVRLEEALDIEVVDRAGLRTRLRATGLPPPFHLVGGLLAWPALGARDRLAALRLGLALRRLGGRSRGGGVLPGELDRQTVDEWLVARGQTPRLREMLWEPLAVAALNQPPGVAAAAPFVRVLAQLFGGSRRDAAIGLPVTSLDEMYAEPARDWLERHRCEVRAGAPARLLPAPGGGVIVSLREERLEAPIVVSSVAWFALPALAGGVPGLAPLVEAAAATAPSPIVTVNLWLDRRVTETGFVGLPGRTFQWVFDKAQLLGGGTSHLSLVSSGADDVVGWQNGRLIEQARNELAAALPGAGSATLLRASTVREKRATFSLAPGQPARPGPVTAVPGLLLAGDWTDTGLPATIEGAVVSGHRAADLAPERAIRT